jgi:hypothetical protein
MTGRKPTIPFPDPQTSFMKTVLLSCALLASAFLHAQESERVPLNERRTTVKIWNQHNGGFNDRGSTMINVVLITKDKEVFRKDGIIIPWERGQDKFVSVIVPSVATDTVRVEIVESVNERPGLAEIEFVRNGKNLARKRSVKVNGVWESHPGVTGDTLTDGVTTSSKHQYGYWCSPDKEKAWAEVQVKTRD